MITDEMRAGIVTLRPFVPAKDFAASLAFYEALGFRAHMLGPRMAHLQLGAADGSSAFLLQDYYTKEFAENFMMHLLVTDLDSWWEHIASLDLDGRFGANIRAPKLEPWGLRVAYIGDPSGVLWHIASGVDP